ncbi:MAG: hypothetical protein IK116_05450 [Firmicutes bacterium]|nr:hypothetical protein [Bacillota bacterium]
MAGKSIANRYRLLPLICVGALVMIALVLLFLLLWAFAAYGGQRDPAANGMGALIYFGSVFIACMVMTLLIRGGTVFPSAILALLATFATVFLAPDGAGFGKVLLKIIVTLLVAAAGFAVAKLLSIFYLPERRRPQPIRREETLPEWDDEIRSMREPR